MKQTNYKNILKGVSTLDIMNKKLIAPIFFVFFLVFIAYCANVFGRGGHSTLDLIDPGFDPQIRTNSYSPKWVSAVHSLPDGKILAVGSFNTFNGVSVGKLIRLNPDGSLDWTFNNQTVTDAQSQSTAKIFVQSDGKIIVRCDGLSAGGQTQRNIMRFNADGTLDPTFNYTQTGYISQIFMDSLGRLMLLGYFTTPQTSITSLLRLNSDGSVDTSFSYQLPSNTLVNRIAMQGNKVIVSTQGSSPVEYKTYRINEDGSPDSSFTPSTEGITLVGIQSNNKILYAGAAGLSRLNENGGTDNTFQTTDIPEGIDQDVEAKFTSDGKIVVHTAVYNSKKLIRYLANGGVDSTFNQPASSYLACFTIQPDESIIVGDGNAGGDPATFNINKFVRLTPAGNYDATFNPNGTGFQKLLPGIIEGIESQPDGKVLLGGKFNLINQVSRSGIARLNPDSTVDTSFQLNVTGGNGNYFSMMSDVYQIRLQEDGKILVSGFFEYVLNGVTKKNFVRLNSDGSIDPTFNLTFFITDYSQVNLAGQNRFDIYSDGSLMIGTSRNVTSERAGPIRLNVYGSHDKSFNSTLNGERIPLAIEDLALQPDGKVLVSGSYSTSAGFRSFFGRINANGSPDNTFPYTEEPGRFRTRLVRLPDGKILVSKYDHPNGGSAKIQRLNQDGSVDNTFNTISLSDATAKISALLVLPNGKFFAGGKFTITVNGQERKNLLLMNADGNFETTIYNVNSEVLCLATDSDDRVLVGGEFTVIGANGENASRSYVARLTDSRPRFDFDGDGLDDVGVFTPANGKWVIHHSGARQTFQTIWGLPDDKLIPADYDGDGITDIAAFRPSDGIWYMLRSRDGYAEPKWGMAGDKPVVADYDGDGIADLAVWRPENLFWYIRQSSNGKVRVVQFGLDEDIPLGDADFDGDGKSDIAVWRPSTGVWYWLASGTNQFRAVQLGSTGDIPVVGDFNGDGKTDWVIFRPSEGNWYQYLTEPNDNYTFALVHFGLNGDEPVAADYDGDGKTDIAVRRGNIWHINRSEQGYTSFAFAQANDIAVASSLGR